MMRTRVGSVSSDSEWLNTASLQKWLRGMQIREETRI
jgi:hypothetical protein